MKLREDYRAPGDEVPYLLDTGDGQFAEGRMRATVAEEIVHAAETRELGDREGFELVVDGNMLFPKDAFALEADERLERLKRASRKKGRPTKKELLEEAAETMTNPQLHRAIEDVKRGKAPETGKAEG